MKHIYAVPGVCFVVLLLTIDSTKAQRSLVDLLFQTLGLGEDGSETSACGKRSLQLVYQWTTLTYATPRGFVPDPSFNNSDAFITGITTYKSKLYLATSRKYSFVPSTLSTIPKNASSNVTNPALQPYPDISWHMLNGNSTNCNKTLVSVTKATRDKCNRLWAMDNGSAYSFKDKKQISYCPPKLVVFDLDTNKMVKLVTLPSDILEPKSRLFNIAIDNVVMSPGSNGSTTANNTCDDIFLYIADSIEPAIISYGVQNNTFYRFKHTSMFLDPSVPYFTVDGQNITTFNGITGLTVAGTGSKRYAYYCSLNSYQVYKIPTAILQQPNNFADTSDIPVTEAFMKPAPGISLFYHNSSNCILFNPITNGTIAGYSLQSQSQSVLATNRTLLRTVFSMTDDTVNTQNVYMADSRYTPRRNRTDSKVINAKILLLSPTT